MTATASCLDSCWNVLLEEEEMFEDDESTIVLDEGSISTSRALALTHRASTVGFLLPSGCNPTTCLESSALLCQHSGICNTKAPTHRHFKNHRMYYRYCKYLKAHSATTDRITGDNNKDAKHHGTTKTRKRRKKRARAFWIRLAHYLPFIDKICSCDRNDEQRPSHSVPQNKPASEQLEEDDPLSLSHVLQNYFLASSQENKPEDIEATSVPASINVPNLKEESKTEGLLSSLRAKRSLCDRLWSRKRNNRRQKHKRQNPNLTVQFYPAC